MPAPPQSHYHHFPWIHTLEEVRRETKVEGEIKYLGGLSIHVRSDAERGMGEH